MSEEGWMRLLIVSGAIGLVGFLWQRHGKPWCDRVSEATRHPRLTRIGLVALLYGGLAATVFGVGFIADVVNGNY